jgi:hypothetical protein
MRERGARLTGETSTGERGGTTREQRPVSGGWPTGERPPDSRLYWRTKIRVFSSVSIRNYRKNTPPSRRLCHTTPGSRQGREPRYGGRHCRRGVATATTDAAAPGRDRLTATTRCRWIRRRCGSRRIACRGGRACRAALSSVREPDTPVGDDCPGSLVWTDTAHTTVGCVSEMARGQDRAPCRGRESNLSSMCEGCDLNA